jgi:hypothetical protein
MLKRLKDKINSIKLKRKLLKISKNNQCEEILAITFLYCLGLIFDKELKGKKENDENQHTNGSV